MSRLHGDALNNPLRPNNQILPARGQWLAWTPTITQLGVVTFTNNYSRYNRVGRRIECSFSLTVTGAGTGANNVIIGGLPATAASSGVLCGTGEIADISAPQAFPSAVILASTTTAAFRAIAAIALTNPLLGTSNFTAALAAGDLLNGTFVYEAAADI